jgi:FkbM family methyltransferase
MCSCYNLGAYSSEGALTFWQIKGTSNIEQLSGFENSFHPKHLDRIKKELSECGGLIEKLEVKSVILNSLLDLHNIKKVDYLSIDAEGSELEVLKGIDLLRKDITLISCEDNYGVEEITDYLSRFGYIRLIKVCLDVFYFKLF